MGSRLTIEMCPVVSPEVQDGGRDVVVSGLDADMDVEDILPMLENTRKGGGPVENVVQIDSNTVHVTFAQESSTEAYLLVYYSCLWFECLKVKQFC